MCCPATVTPSCGSTGIGDIDADITAGCLGGTVTVRLTHQSADTWAGSINVGCGTLTVLLDLCYSGDPTLATSTINLTCPGNLMTAGSTAMTGTLSPLSFSSTSATFGGSGCCDCMSGDPIMESFSEAA